MIKITKNECLRQSDQKWKLLLFIAIGYSLFRLIRYIYKFNNLLIPAIIICVMGIVSYFLCYFMRKRTRGLIKRNKFYLVEDVFLSSEEKRAQKHYKIKFSRNGYHTIQLMGKEEPKNMDADYSTVFFSRAGDKFYILITVENGTEKIFRCYNAKYYEISDEDFELIDGKYYPKK